MHFFCNSNSSISIFQPKNQLKHFSYTELLTATNCFSQLNFLGKGSQGSVYLATFNNCSTAAVKIITSTETETPNNELNILSCLRTHRIVNLIGYAVNSNVSPPNLLLVVEHMPNGSLYDILHNKINLNPPGFLTRVRFLLQIAKAVRTLHGSDPPVMHRDIKSSNILIDDRGNARLSDFGLAIKGHVSDTRVMSTPPAGTLGYLDPCYIEPSDLSTKSDVFSFGILLFEVISGRKAIDVEFSPPYIVEWALPLIKSGGYQGVLDRRISGWEGVNRTVVRELCLLGVSCVRSTAEKRPSVGEIVECIKKVYRRVKLKRFDIWSNLRRHVETSRPFDDGFDDGNDDWKRNRRVSNVEEELTRGRNPTVRIRSSRSKSIGSFREIAKVGPDLCVNDVVKVKRKGQVTKSRSMSVFNRGKNEDVEVKKEVEVLPLLVNSKGSEISNT